MSPSKLSDMLTHSQDSLARKAFLRNHRLLQPVLELLNTCKKESILPQIDLMSLFESIPQPGTIDFGVEDFIQSQGIETQQLNSEDVQKNQEREDFLFKLEQVREKYREELEKLDKVCQEFSSKMLALLREQSVVRPITTEESEAKVSGIQQKFDFVKSQLRQNVCSAVLALQKQYKQTKKKRRTLPKKATEGLSTWFFEHINDPYPSEEEKSLLAAGGGLTITQVNNWFGNKRIRYKRKCLEEEAKRSRLIHQDREHSVPMEPEPMEHLQQSQILPIAPLHPSRMRTRASKKVHLSPEEA